MMVIVIFVALATTVSCESIQQDLYNIFYNLPVAFQDCNNTEVLRSNIIYTLYTRENQVNGIILNNGNLNEVNPANRVVCIIHGWLQSRNQSWVIQTKDVYLNKAPMNVIVVDWSKDAGMIYGASYCAVPKVGNITGDLIHNISVINAIAYDVVEITGFSLGGHVAGYAGQRVQALTAGKKIGRITGLDIAGPGYLGNPPSERLDSRDAKVVQGIHTNGGGFGYLDAYGTVDFQVNSVRWLILSEKCGYQQPCCPTDPGVPSNGTPLSEILPRFFCHHIRAAVYFIASITSSDFLGVPCNCKGFSDQSCKNNSKTIMGENCPSTASGEHFLNPNGVPPYPRGLNGTGGIGGYGGWECLPPEIFF